MPGKGKRSTSVGISEMRNEQNEVLLNLTKLMEQMNKNLRENNVVLHTFMSEMKGSIDKLVSNIEKRNDESQIVTEIQATDTVSEQVTSVTGNCQSNYLSMWKELGGGSLQFRPNGDLHPVAFIKKLASLFEDAEIPENKQIGLAVGALRGSASDWGQIKQDSCRNFDNFKQKFLNRYWSIETQREIFREIKFGVHERGSRADYFLKMVREVTYLDNPPNENETVDIIVRHFSGDTRRGIVSLGLKSVEEVEQYLRKIDETHSVQNIQANHGLADRHNRYNNYSRENANRVNGNNNFRRDDRRIERNDRNISNSGDDRQIRESRVDSNEMPIEW